MYQLDTIAAISTALGEGAIGIVRMSGPEAIEYANRLFREKDLNQVASHTIHYGHIYREDQSIIDEVMITVLKAPKTYTREDIIEINCHGGLVAVQEVLEACLYQGARLAQPGEFTKRAFLNGRLDLSQAEALMDLIQAKTAKSMSASMSQLSGSLSSKIKHLRNEMLQTLAQVEVTIDYPEYDDVEELSNKALCQTALVVKDEIDKLLNEASNGQLLREGVKTVIVGRPNVGKSSLLNRLTGREKAIVTNIAGTTRDTIEELISIRGIPLLLIDTAGIRDTNEIVEQIGVNKSRQMVNEADLIILMFDQSQALSPMDLELIDLTKDKKRIVLLNKQDLKPVLDIDKLKEALVGTPLIETSLMTDEGIYEMENQIESLFNKGAIESQDVNYLLNTRHTNLLKQAIRSLDAVIEASQMGVPVDLIQIDFTQAWDYLGEITGESVQDELLDKLFSQFCLGK
ncbi:MULTISPECIES: tRNA uridine-5-carboxymethylaminomethyl(34) synthesis GTPase MnmE [Facklamia]|uniref:tRNA modification GTPase MnmE n=1 Tax=Facklamia hominis TaxID=178214 RepID=A0AAJ1Q6D7_9LACT|nr:tRNA uridine-5-carboxymethylaminomethyl(34) synthesis GTPase MnmE [Facklamia sp. HMSC062C11]MDK7187392.1 tRNA uridine-5-carboxymethylaminomethyl(34) synthesis GTPase MnmE [Facklamia hominis]